MLGAVGSHRERARTRENGHDEDHYCEDGADDREGGEEDGHHEPCALIPCKQPERAQHAEHANGDEGFKLRECKDEECKHRGGHDAKVEHIPRVAKVGCGAPRGELNDCLLYTSPSPRDRQKSRMPSSA